MFIQSCWAGTLKSAAAVLIKPFFSSGALSQGVRALFMSIPCTVLPSKEAVSSLPACSGYAELLWAPPCCCGLCPALMGFALLLCVIPCSPVYMGVVRAAMVMVACLCSDRLSLLWQVASAMAGCISNGRVPPYGSSALVVVDAPRPLICTILGSAVLALKLSSPSVFNCCFVCFCGGGTRQA